MKAPSNESQSVESTSFFSSIEDKLGLESYKAPKTIRECLDSILSLDM